MNIKTMSEAIAAYDDMLDVVYAWHDVAGINFAPSDTLRALDPIAYRCGFADWADAEGIDTDELKDDVDLP